MKPELTLHREWLADLLMGRREAFLRVPVASAEQLREVARTQGVLAMAAWQLHLKRQDNIAPKGDPSHSRLDAIAPVFAAAAREEAVLSMQLEQGTRQVLQQLSSAGIPSLLLKGSALSFWAYEQPQLRRCNDIDLLLPSRQAAESLAEGLSGLGYEQHQISPEPVSYELLCTKAVSPHWELEVDIHWQLCNSALFAGLFSFDELMQASMPLPLLGANARALGPVHALVHACMHRALNLATGWEDHLKWLYDLIVLMDRLSDADWQLMTHIAQEKGLAGVVLSGMESAASDFKYALPQQVVADLRLVAEGEKLDRSRLAEWRYMQWQTFLALKTHQRRLLWLWQRLFPTQERLTNRYGERANYALQMWQRLKSAFERVVN